MQDVPPPDDPDVFFPWAAIDAKREERDWEHETALRGQEKLENHLHMLSLYFVHYNFVRMHKTLKMTPAMAAGVTDTLHDMAWLANMVDASLPKPGPRGPYKKKGRE